MTYEPKNFDSLLGTPGFSDTLLKNHFTLYQGYVTNVNKLMTDLASAEKSGWLGTPGWSELKRRFGWEWNGMRLHELYFANMHKAPAPLNQNAPLTSAITTQFGSFDTWLKDFKTVGSMRGIGWAILYRDNATGTLFNEWVNEHDMGHLTGCTPLLVLDIFEHAYATDYGIKKADYLEAFTKAIDWSAVANRFQS